MVPWQERGKARSRKARSRTQVSWSCPLPRAIMDGGCHGSPSQLLCPRVSAHAGTQLPWLLGGQASCGRKLLGKGERAVGGPWDGKKCSRRDHTQKRAIWSDGPSSPVCRPEARGRQRGDITGSPRVRDTPPATFSWGHLSKTTSLSSTKLFCASQTLLVGRALVTTLENSLEVSPTLWSLSSPAFSPPQKCVHVVTQRCIQERSQQCYS